MTVNHKTGNMSHHINKIAVAITPICAWLNADPSNSKPFKNVLKNRTLRHVQCIHYYFWLISIATLKKTFLKISGRRKNNNHHCTSYILVVAISECRSDQRTLWRKKMFSTNVFFLILKKTKILLNCLSHPKAVTESSAGRRTGSADVATHCWLLTGRSIQICHRPGTAGTQKPSWPRRSGA